MEAIVECPLDEFVPGRIGECFRGGARAVLLNDPRVTYIWKTLFDSLAQTNGSLFSEDSLLQIAQNHRAGDLCAGDMLRFIPGGIGHIARKIVFARKEDGTIESIPRDFSNGTIPHTVLGTVWDLMTDVLRSTFPAQSVLPPYDVTIEFLKYPSSFEEVTQIAALLSDSCGEWTRLGMKMDTWKMEAAGLWNMKYLRDCTAVASLIPGLRKVLGRLNKWMMPFSNRHVQGKTRLIGSPHCDGSKILTAMLSERETITTEIYAGRQWLTLPLRSDRLTIIPSLEMASNLGILPTLHRILVQEHPPLEKRTARNITLNLTVRPRAIPA
jgi:hypothetical protein